MNYSGIDMIKPRMIARMMGSGTGHRFGAGFLRKAGIRYDQIDFMPNNYSLSYVIRGRGEYIDIRKTRYPLSAGSIFQRFPSQKHSTVLDPESNWAECFIDFDPALFNMLNEIGILRKDIPVFSVQQNSSYESSIYALTCSLEKASPEELPRLFIQALDVLEKIYAARMDNTTRESAKFIRRACDILAETADTRIDLRTLIESHGWGYEWFRKHFKRELGVSPGQYILQRRMEMACNMILSTDMSFLEIAYDLGYNNSHEFFAQFKKHLGQTPGQYRKAHAIP